MGIIEKNYGIGPTKKVDSENKNFKDGKIENTKKPRVEIEGQIGFGDLISLGMEHEEFLTTDDFRGQEINKSDLEEINGHPERYDGSSDVIFEEESTDDEIIGKTPTGIPMYKNDDVEDLYGPKIKQEKEKDPLMELREKQLLRIKETQEEMIKNKDGRHLFLINSGRLMESPEGFKFWKGHLAQDVLAVKGDKGLELKPLLPDNGIKISHPKDKNITWKISHFNARHKGIPKLDLTTAKIDSPKKLHDEILKLNKK